MNCIVELDGGASLRAMMLNCRHSVAQVKEGDTTWFQIPSTGLRLIPNS
ncbi:hypothetical protein [Numidum massiliense]